jgi:hypothetical protein
MNKFEQDLEDFRKALCERAALIMKEHEAALASKRKRRRAGARGLAQEATAESAQKAMAMTSAGPPMLTGWKEIAQAVGNVSVRTLQRWEKKLGLPIGRAGTLPVAAPEEIRRWKEKHLEQVTRMTS